MAAGHRRNPRATRSSSGTKAGEVEEFEEVGLKVARSHVGRFEPAGTGVRRIVKSFHLSYFNSSLFCFSTFSTSPLVPLLQLPVEAY
jgi:hypothetical protein